MWNITNRMMMLQLLLLTVFLPATAYGAALGGYESQGCFQDRADRTIEPLEGQDPILDGSYEGRAEAINKCYQAANSRGFKVFAVQNGGWCASSASAEDTYDKYGASSACNADGEGGPWANQVYFIITGYESQGCFQDRPSRAIATLEGQDDILDGNYQARADAINKCYQAAKSQGFKVFAVQHGGWCASSATAEDTYDKYGPSSACNADGEGGPWANEVYLITVPNCSTLTSPSNGVIVGNCNRQYLSVCRFQCMDGFEGSGSEERKCIVLPSNEIGWSGTPLQCFEKRCPITHVLFAQIPSGTCRAPDGTVVHELVYRTVCTFECNRGYNLVGNQNVTCQLDKQWYPVHPTCEEVRCPKLPSVPVGTFSPATCTIGTMRFDSTCALMCPSGYHIHPGDITLTTDVRRCNTDGSWEYRAVSPTCRDTEPPTCSFCPLDIDIIIDDATSDQVRVNWERPTCMDNSGVPPSIESNMNSGDLLAVPGSYEVRYQVTDAEGNTDNNCSFRITLKKKTCPLYAPPKNGALTCIDTDGELSCAAMCNEHYDFVFTPPMLYFCSQGTWQFFSIGPYVAALPWPDCSKTANPSWLRMANFIQYHFFVGDANKSDVQDTLRGSFFDLLHIPRFFCQTAQCTKENVLVFPGET